MGGMLPSLHIIPAGLARRSRLKGYQVGKEHRIWAEIPKIQQISTELVRHSFPLTEASSPVYYTQWRCEENASLLNKVLIQEVKTEVTA
jgi:hypothetical protein